MYTKLISSFYRYFKINDKSPKNRWKIVWLWKFNLIISKYYVIRRNINNVY